MTPPSPPPTRQPAALSAGDRATLLSPSTVSAYLSFAPQDPSVWEANYKVTAQVDLPTGWPGGTVNYTDIPIKNKSVNWDTIVNYSNSGKGLLVYIGTSAGASDIGVFRTRKWSVGVNYLRIVEIGPGDPGMIPLSIASSSIADGHYITVFNDAPLWAMLTRIDFSGGGSGVFYKDYDRAWAGETVWGPWTMNLGPHRAGFVDPVTKKLRLTFTPQITYPTYPGPLWGETVSNNVPIGINADNNPVTYTWTYPGGTVVSGGNYSDASRVMDAPVTAAAITLDYGPGFYVIRCDAQYQVVTVPSCLTGIVVANQIIQVTAIRCIWVHDGILGDSWATFPAIPISELRSDNATQQSRSMQLSVYGNDWVNYRKGTMVQYWETPSWGGSDVASATRQFTGFIANIQDTMKEGLKSVDIDISGVGDMLDRIPASSNRLDDPNNYTAGVTPTVCASTWQQWVQPTAEQFIAYLLQYHVANLLTLFDYNPMTRFDGALGSLNWWFPAIGFQVSTGSIWSQLKSFSQRAGLNIGTDSTGAIWLRPDPSMLPYSDRTTAAGGTPNWTTIANRDTIDETIYTEIDFPQPLLTKVHKVNGSAFYWTGAPPVPQAALLAVWPGGSMGYGTSEDQMNDMLVYDQVHLNQLVGNKAAVLNNPLAGIRVRIPGNRDVYEPAHWSYVTLTVPAFLDPNNVGFTKRCIVKSRSKSLDIATGVADIELVIDAETYGQPGVTVPLTGRIIPPPPPPPGNDCALAVDPADAAYCTLTKTGTNTYTINVTTHDPGLGCGDFAGGVYFPCTIFRRISITNVVGFTYEGCGVYPGGYQEKGVGSYTQIPTTIHDPVNDATWHINNRCVSSFYIRSATAFSFDITVSEDSTCP